MMVDRSSRVCAISPSNLSNPHFRRKLMLSSNQGRDSDGLPNLWKPAVISSTFSVNIDGHSQFTGDRLLPYCDDMRLIARRSPKWLRIYRTESIMRRDAAVTHINTRAMTADGVSKSYQKFQVNANTVTTKLLYTYLM